MNWRSENSCRSVADIATVFMVNSLGPAHNRTLDEGPVLHVAVALLEFSLMI
jgi:hypothetical protein